MASGRLSYARGEGGERLVEVAELERVFGVQGAVDTPRHVAPEPVSPDTQLFELRAKLEIELARVGMLNERIGELRDERDRWRQQAERLLTDQRSKSSAGWWQRLWS